jgi:hypothetical protein
MSVTPRISLVAYEERVGGFVFVAVPNERGRYVRTDKSVVLVECPMCHASVGEPCTLRASTPDGYTAGTHANRRDRAKVKFFGVRGEDRIEPVDIAAHGFPAGERPAAIDLDTPPVRPRLFGSIDLIEPRAIA